MNTNKKKANPLTEFLKTILSVIITLIVGVAFGLFWVAADMAEHPELSGVSPEDNVIEITYNLAEDVLSA